MKLPFNIPADRKFWITIAIYAVAALLIIFFLPRSEKVQLSYEKNRPWSNPQLLAPFDIPYYLAPEIKQERIDSIDRMLIPVYDVDPTVQKNLIGMILELDSVSQSTRDAVIMAVKKIYDAGVITTEDAQRIAVGELQRIRISSGSNNEEIATAKMRTSRQAYEELEQKYKIKNPNLWRRLQAKNISSYLQPNMKENAEKTAEVRNSLLTPIEAVQGVIQKGEEIINRGEMVTPQRYQILQDYEQELTRRDKERGISKLNVVFGRILFAASLMVVIYIFLYLYRKEIFNDMSRTICLLSLYVGFFAFTVFMSDHFVDGIYIVPFAILPILLVVFFDNTVAMFFLIMEIVLCSLIAKLQFEFCFIQFSAGMTAIYSMRELSRRSQLMRTALLVFISYVVTYAAAELVQIASLNTFSWKLIGFFAINMVLTSFAYIMIFIVEKVFGLISVVTLVELSDINNPILRELSEECPGTFQHSMAVANLVTAAANRVNANVQLVRAGALYHDIGKTKNPAFFTENQHGVNPHNALTPVQSARVIIGHVTDGLRMAEKANLPKIIRDMIVQHHGKTTARYFYNTYCNAHPGEEVDPTPFTYPGPNPQSKEASLLMMADVVEAASRSLPDHKPETIRALVNKLIDMQVAEGLHKDSPLSFRDITTIKKAFVDSLLTMYHVRIAYPDKK
ncbi:MAG: HDIG domain-containing protein [Muribaculaceae bacterium]|nr:HDIG domain-containing protein [Muribaculaceae bacterium]